MGTFLSLELQKSENVVLVHYVVFLLLVEFKALLSVCTKKHGQSFTYDVEICKVSLYLIVCKALP